MTIRDKKIVALICMNLQISTAGISHSVVIRVYDEAGNVIETHKHAGQLLGKQSFLVVMKLGTNPDRSNEPRDTRKQEQPLISISGNMAA